MSPLDDVKNLIDNHARRLQILRERQAREGNSIDPSIRMEIEDIEKEIEGLQKQTFLTIDSRPLLGIENGRIVSFTYDALKTVNELLNQIYYSQSPNIPAYTYRKKWVLREAKTGKVFTGIGTRWAKEHGLEKDMRSLREVNIGPGMTLEIISPGVFEVFNEED